MSSTFVPSVCPHDCPSTCALEVERLDAHTIGRVRGAAANPYTDGVVCAKVSRYAERVHHPDRLTHPLRRVGAKGEGRFEPLSWDEALDLVARALRDAETRHGPEAVWPYFYAGTMGHVQRDGLVRLTRARGWSRLGRTICSAVARAGWVAGAGEVRGVDPREMTEADLVVLWGGNFVATQIHAMNRALEARQKRKATLVTVDPYRTRTAALSDIHLMVRPGTDGALACAVMHVLFAEGLADRGYLDRYTRGAAALEEHLRSRSPAWAAALTGLAEDQIVAFARLWGKTPRAFLRLGYGFTRQRNGAAAMHAVSCLPAVSGAWQHRGGGALFANSALYHLDKTLIEGEDLPDTGARTLDMSRFGEVLTGERDALGDGPPVTAMVVQNTNPAVVAPDTARVRDGLARDDLFLCVHEQFLTETARFADIVLPATTFLEHDDLYTGGGHTFLQVARAVIEPFADCRPNHHVVCALAARLGAAHRGFSLSAWAMVDETLRASGHPDAETLAATRWHDCAAGFETAHFRDGFPTADRRFHFEAPWGLPDQAPGIEDADAEHPFRLITAPARNFLNSSFSRCPTSRKAEGCPAALVHPDDARVLAVADGERVRLGNRRGSVVVRLAAFDGLPRGVVVVESLWSDADFEEGKGINTLVGAGHVPPTGGAAFHDVAVWMKPA